MAWTDHLPPLGELTGELVALALVAWGWSQLGRRKHRDLARGRGEVRRLARELGGEPTEHGNRLEVLADTDGREMLQALREGILGARRRICIGTYILSNDVVGREVVSLLTRRAREGVEVRLLVDAIGSRRPPWLALRRLRKAGGQVARFNPLLSLRGRGSANWRNHRKIAVFDGVGALIGGHNLGLWYVGDRPRRRRFRDASFRITGPAAGQLENVFLTDWCQATGASPRELEAAFRDRPGPAGEIQAEVIDSGPDAPEDPLWNRLRDLVGGARLSVEIATPYFVPDAGMVATLRDRLAAGVRVRIIVPRFSDHPITDFARRATLRELRDLGAEVLLHRRGVLHAKLLVVDGETAVVGSGNFDMRSFFLNYEVAVVVRGETALADLCRLMATFAAESRPPSPASVRRAHTWHGRLLERAAGWIAPLL